MIMPVFPSGNVARDDRAEDGGYGGGTKGIIELAFFARIKTLRRQ
jgi:hypothetical protein